jgi:pimeloyl-ACP methyl ester carboxylesterase
MTKTRIRAVAIAAVAAAALATAVPVAQSAAAAGNVTATQGWAGVARQPVQIDMGRGWTAGGELDYPQGAHGRLPVVVLLHGSGHNDMDQTMPDGSGSTFVPISQAVAHRDYAVLRFNKRGVTGVGPVLTDDQSQLAPPKPYEQILRDAASVVRFAAASPRVDPSRIYLLGHSEGTQVAANLAANPSTYGIPKPAGVIAMGVVGKPVKDLLTYQIFGVKLARLHEQFDVNGDGYLTHDEATDGLIGESPADADAYRKVLVPTTDRNHDGRFAIDGEVGPVLRKATGIDAYPNVPGIDQATRDYAVDIARFGDVSQDLPRFHGPTLLLNGEDDIQTPVRAALVANAAVGAAGNPDHQIITYPGMAHTMNRTTKFSPAFGSPDKAVLADIQRWLSAHR